MQNSAIEVVVAPSGNSIMFWDARGTMHIALDHDQAGRFIGDLCDDVTVPRVEFKRDATLMRIGHAVLDKLKAPKQQAEGEAVAVHVVAMLVPQPDDRFCATLWPPKGGPRTYTSPSELGRALFDLAADQTQPRVPAGAPSDASTALLERGATWLANDLLGPHA